MVHALEHDPQNVVHLKSKVDVYELKVTSCATKPHLHNLISKLVLMFFDNKAVVFLVEPSKNFKPNLYYTQGNTSQRVTSGGAHLRGLAPG